MKFLQACKRGMISGKVIKWIIALAIIVAAGFAVRGIIGKFG
jgi:hypothetical protein